MIAFTGAMLPLSRRPPPSLLPLPPPSARLPPRPPVAPFPMAPRAPPPAAAAAAGLARFDPLACGLRPFEPAIPKPLSLTSTAPSLATQLMLGGAEACQRFLAVRQDLEQFIQLGD